MSKSIVITGRQTALSLAELESLFGSKNITKIGSSAAGVNLASDQIDFNRLGGAMKLGKMLAELPFTDWRQIHDYLLKNAQEFIAPLPDGKIKLGISCYDLAVNPKAINATCLSIKKQAKTFKRSMRIIPNNEMALNSAQVLHNKLTGNELGIELLLIKNGQTTIVAQTTAVQDINAYAARDQARPKRDARVGMLPPKLAQTIINLAYPAAPQSKILFDPFCGTGVLLQEALLMGFNVVGSDIEPRMIDYTQQNLDWFKAQQPLNDVTFQLHQDDACSASVPQEVSTIACETYLGRPFSTEPSPDKLREVIQDVNTIHKKFFQNISRQTKPEFRMCLAVPAWFTRHGIKHLPVLDQLTDMGYTRMSFVHAVDRDLIYHREGQIVGRELVILIRK